MNLEDQVVNLELSKCLHELGVKQESMFYWFSYYENIVLHYISYLHYEEDRKIFLHQYQDAISAFTASELLEILPATLDQDTYLLCSKVNKVYQSYYYHKKYGSNYYGWLYEDENLCTCLAKMLIYLIESKIIEV